MRELTQALRVKAVLLRSTQPEAVAYVAARLHELQDPVGVAAICLAIFDADEAQCEHAVRNALKDDPDWVKALFKQRYECGLPVDAQSMVVARLLHLRRLTGAPCT